MRYLLLCVFSVACIAQSPTPSSTPDGGTVTFVAEDKAAIGAIRSIALQSRVPLGIALGRDWTRLCVETQSFKLVDLNPERALMEIASKTGFTLKKDGRALVLEAPDLESWQRDLLDHQFDSYPAESNVTMAGLGATLSMWVKMEVGTVHTVAGSILSSKDSHRFSLGAIRSASVERLADRIVSLNGGGVWMLRPDKRNPRSANEEEIRVFSYLDDAQEIEQLGCGHSASVPPAQPSSD
ncbi:hypothetical protein DYQ86_10810 [Acidobacteria bacterium AB60]|nr:hypothetical protein DYQ86_10810 [Acidobacteria bacterium AB60]